MRRRVALMSSQVLRASFDPGWNTGAVVFQGARMVYSDTIIGGVKAFKEWWLESGRMNGVKEIVSEKFVPEVGLGGKDQAFSLLVEGAMIMAWDGPIVFKQRDQKSRLFRQHHAGDKGQAERREWLAARGLKFETDHAMDAATHLLVTRRDAKDMDFWHRYWK